MQASTTELAPGVLVLILAALWLLRVVSVLRRGRSAHPAGDGPVRTMVVLGSGGHTAEMLGLLATLDAAQYSPREYVVATTDSTSTQRVDTFEAARRGAAPPQHRLLLVPRSREVGQSYWTSALTTLRALAHAVVLVFRSRPSLLLLNGPGTCVPVAAATLALRLLGVKYVPIIYVESIARVRSLSLSGRILYRVVDQFLVQWPGLAKRYPKAQFIGRLC